MFRAIRKLVRSNPTRPVTRPAGRRLSVEGLEDRSVPAVIPTSAVAIGSDAGGPPIVRVVDPASNQTVFQYQAYESSFTGGVNVALGDVTGDGVPDLIVAPGTGGGPRVQIVDGNTGTVVRDSFVYEPSFTGGVQVAVGDIDGDGKDDVITGTGVGGGPRVVALNGRTGAEVRDFFAYESTFRGGVNVASADVNGDGVDDYVIGTGVGGGPRVVVQSGRDGRELENFFAYDSSFRAGVNVGAGDVNGDGFADVVCGAGKGGAPQVHTVSGKDGQSLGDFFAFDSANRGGVKVGAVDSDGDGHAEIVAGTGSGDQTEVRRFDDPAGHGEHEIETEAESHTGVTVSGTGNHRGSGSGGTSSTTSHEANDTSAAHEANDTAAAHEANDTAATHEANDTTSTGGSSGGGADDTSGHGGGHK